MTAQVQKTIGKITRLVSKIETGETSINLTEFYNHFGDDRHLLWFEYCFIYHIVKVATENGRHSVVELKNETISQYETTNESATSDYEILEDLNETLIDLKTAEGRLETRKRLAILAIMFQLQPKKKGEEANLFLRNEYAIDTVIGWFKTPPSAFGIPRNAYVCYYDKWKCFSSDGKIVAKRRLKGVRFWSRNEPG